MAIGVTKIAGTTGAGNENLADRLFPYAFGFAATDSAGTR
jgi:hypothetical protein